jgi:hypothetical protein
VSDAWNNSFNLFVAEDIENNSGIGGEASGLRGFSSQKVHYLG